MASETVPLASTAMPSYPVTTGGWTTAMFIMLAGVGIIGALASLLVGSSAPEEEAPARQRLPTRNYGCPTRNNGRTGACDHQN